jgi:endonuclease G
VVYDLTPPQKMIGFILPNEESTRNLKDYAVTIDKVEAETGLDFFNLVPQPQQEELEGGSSIDDWEWGK